MHLVSCLSIKMGRCLALALLCCGKPAVADEASDGRALLAANCGRCHAVDPSAKDSFRARCSLCLKLITSSETHYASSMR